MDIARGSGVRQIMVSCYRPNRKKDRFLSGPSQLGSLSVLLVILSLGDFFVTYRLLCQGGQFYEANPLARWVFEQWNIAGMAVYKLGIIGFVILLGETIERKRPGVGRAIMVLGCVTATAVMVQGLRLLQAV